MKVITEINKHWDTVTDLYVEHPRTKLLMKVDKSKNFIKQFGIDIAFMKISGVYDAGSSITIYTKTKLENL